MRRVIKAGVLAGAVMGAFALPSQAAIYTGNGATGFGGTVGSGDISITDNVGGLTITFDRGAGTLNDDLVLYLDTVPGGYGDTSTLSDTADGGRSAISGVNAGNPSRTLATFAPGFGADYAISIQNSFIGVFDLSTPNNFPFLFGQNQSGNNNDASYSITLTTAQLNQLGLNTLGQSFAFEGSYISTSAYRANETIGASISVAADGSGNAGFNNPQVFSTDSVYTLTAVPEPASIGLLGGMSLLLLRRRNTPATKND